MDNQTGLLLQVRRFCWQLLQCANHNPIGVEVPLGGCKDLVLTDLLVLQGDTVYQEATSGLTTAYSALSRGKTNG